VIRWAKFPEDTQLDDELRLARNETTAAAPAALPRLAEAIEADPEAFRPTTNVPVAHS
jgi:hypothetical protein